MIEERVDDADAPDAFQALGNEIRLSVLQTLLAADGPVSFSTLHESSSVDQSAGFAYHLRQLTDRYVRKVGDEEGYVLTFAGRAVARAVAAGTYTDSVDLDPIDLDDPCPFCGCAALTATAADNTVGIACEACGRPVLSLPFPPGAYRDRDPAAVPEAFDAHHRHRLGMLREGVCPECSGAVTATVERVPGPVRDAGSADPDGETDSRSASAASGSPDSDPADASADRVQSTFECEACGYETRSPVALTLLTHPSVVAFYHDHGIDVRDRPIWNVGDEWRETVLSTDPFAVAVSVRLDENLLELFVDRRGRVVDSRRTTIDAGDGDGGSVPSTDETAPDAEDVDAGETTIETGVEDPVDAGRGATGDEERPEPA